MSKRFVKLRNFQCKNWKFLTHNKNATDLGWKTSALLHLDSLCSTPYCFGCCCCFFFIMNFTSRSYRSIQCGELFGIPLSRNPTLLVILRMSSSLWSMMVVAQSQNITKMKWGEGGGAFGVSVNIGTFHIHISICSYTFFFFFLRTKEDCIEELRCEMCEGAQVCTCMLFSFPLSFGIMLPYIHFVLNNHHEIRP